MWRLSKTRRIRLRELRPDDETEFTKAAEASKDFHARWVYAPTTPEEFRTYLQEFREGNKHAYVVERREDCRLLGFVNINHIEPEPYERAVIGYAVFEEFQRRGYMREALDELKGRVFDEFGLHRIEADIQPGNERSIRLVHGAGYHQDGFSPAFIKFRDQWLDHQRWAIVKDDERRPPTTSFVPPTRARSHLVPSLVGAASGVVVASLIGLGFVFAIGR